MSQIEDRSPLCLDPQFHFQVSAKVPFHVRKQLERYQIFTSQFDDTGMLHPSFKVIGFYHALKMYGVISDFELFQIYLQIRTFCISPEDIDIICRKFHIHIVLFLILPLNILMLCFLITQHQFHHGIFCRLILKKY